MSLSRLFAWGWMALSLAPGVFAGDSLNEAPPADEKAAESRPVADMGTRFQLWERYGLDEGTKPEAIGQYRVGILEKMKVLEERPQGSPIRTEGSVQTIFAERPSRVSEIGVVQATVRRYDTYRQTPNPNTKSSARLLEGMTLWYQPKSGADPLVMSLNDKRGLRELEYLAISQEVFFPSLISLLPPQATRIGDRWSVSKQGTWALLGETPVRGAPLLAQLEVVQLASEGMDWEAIITINGRVSLPRGDTTVNARLAFRFSPPAAIDRQAEPKPAGEHEIVQARGGITELRMTTVSTAPISDTSTRLRRITTQQLVLARQFNTLGGPVAPPETLPLANEQNSWLLYDDPEGFFHFRHPQDFRLGPLTSPGDMVELLRGSAQSPDRIEFMLQHKTGDEAADRNNRDPEFHVGLLKESWRQHKQDILPGPKGWLPEADWAPLKMKVYRVNAALRSSNPLKKRDARVHFDEYIVQFGRGESLVVKSTTVQDPPTPFRKQVEAVLKTFRLGPSTAH